MSERRLWDINQDLLILAKESVDPETGEVLEDISERFAEIEGEREDKIVAWTCYIKGERVKAEAIRAEGDRVQEEGQSILDRALCKKNAADHSQRRLATLLKPDDRIEQPAALVKWHKQQDALEVDSLLLPAAYWHQPPIPAKKPGLQGIRKRLTQGKRVKGAKLIPQPAKLVIE